MERVHAVLLCGGSAFGLCAADGAMRALEEKGIGFDVGLTKVPIVGAAVLFDLSVGDYRARPRSKWDMRRRRTLPSAPLAQGAVGAGAGATVSKMLGLERARKSGFGCASIKAGGATVAAAFAVNALGNVYDYRNGAMVCGPRPLSGNGKGGKPQKGTNTTIGVVATDAKLTREQAKRLAIIGHDGLAMAIRPVHTPYDGDTVFALSTALRETNTDLVFACAAEVVARAIFNAVVCAQEHEPGICKTTWAVGYVQRHWRDALETGVSCKGISNEWIGAPRSRGPAWRA